MSITSEQTPVQPWYVEQTDTQLMLCHDYRWLRIIGIPITLGGTAVAIAIWFLPALNYASDWPILAVGSLIATGFALIGLHLSLNRVVFTADCEQGILLRREGFGVFTRTMSYYLDEIKSVSVVRNDSVGDSLTSFRLELNTANRPIFLAGYVDRQPLEAEAKRWRNFLGLSDN